MTGIFRRNSDHIRYRIRLMGTPRVEASQRLWGHPRLAELLPWAVIRSYQVANASVPLMEAALARARSLADDAVAEGMIDYLTEHIGEETGHDEQVLDDLETIGFTRDFVKERVPTPSLAALIGMQYYWIQHRHPIAFVGYAATIEGNPVPVDDLERVRQQTDLPATLFRTLLWHSRHDAEHSEEMDHTLDALPITPEQMSLIGVNVAHTQRLLAMSVDELIGEFERRSRRPA